MKKIILLIVLSCIFESSISYSQTGTGTLPIYILVRNNQSYPITDATKNTFRNRIATIISSFGLISSEAIQQFAIISDIDVVDKKIIEGAPTQIIMSLAINIKIIDIINNYTLKSITIESQGVGTNENKALVSGLITLSANNTSTKDFFRNTINEINSFYDRQYTSLLKQAEAAVAIKDFEKAMFILTNIPLTCIGYNEAQVMGRKYYSEYNAYECRVNLKHAKEVWAADKTKEGAQRAMEYIGKIDPDAKGYSEVSKFLKEVSNSNKDIWDLTMKVYQDQVELQKREIDAWKQVGIAYGKNQKQIILKSFL